MVSTKFYCGYDEDVYVSEWAEGTTMTAARLKQLELEFLCALNWNLYVSNAEFFDKLKGIEVALARQQGVRRGWLTYTELTHLLPSLAIAKSFLQYSTVFAVSYAASVFTIAGAFLLASQVPGTALYNSSSSSSSTSTSSPKSEILVTQSNDTSCLNDSTLPANNDLEDINNLEEVLKRLNCNQLQDDEDTASTYYTGNLSTASVLVDMVQVELRQHFCRSGINLRCFLDDNTTDENDTDENYGNNDAHENATDWNLMDGMHDAFVEASCQAKQYGQLMHWVRFI